MKKISTVVLQILVVALGIGVLIFMLWEPHLEGRNVDATLFQIYFNDPFLAYAYTASIAFFIALYQTYKVLEYIRHERTYSQASVQAVRIVKYCAMVLIAFIVGAEGYLVIVQRRVEEDIAGGVMMGLFLIVTSAIIATAAALLEKRLRLKVPV